MKTDTAAVVIDVQKGMFAVGDPVYNAEGLLEKLKSLIARAWEAGAEVIFVQHNETPPGEIDFTGQA